MLGPSGPSQEVGALAELPDAYGCAADAVQPFYVQQCSYEAASLARAGGAHLQPGTPSRRAEGVRTQLAALRLAPPSHAVDASFVWVAAGQVGAGQGTAASMQGRLCLPTQLLLRRSRWVLTQPDRMLLCGTASWGA